MAACRETLDDGKQGSFYLINDNDVFIGLLNISLPWQIHAQEEAAIISWRECSKKSVQQGRSHFGARSVLSVREHGTMARTPLAAFFNIPFIDTAVLYKSHMNGVLGVIVS
jgi:hypothetical protein